MLGLAVVSGIILNVTRVVLADTPKTAAEYAADPALMIDAYRHVEAASVSDAIEQLLHEKRYMSHRMQSIFPTKFAGTAPHRQAGQGRKPRSECLVRDVAGNRLRWAGIGLRDDG